MQTPTDELYGQLQAAYHYLNHHLFDDQLPGCLFTLQRRNKILGHYSHSRFLRRDAGGKTDEIALNSTYFATRTVEQTLSTLLHEMVHQWQFHFGTPSRSCYHNREWADKMISVGLMPTDTGEPGGKQVGQRVTHYILPDGPYQALLNELYSQHGEMVTWVDAVIDWESGRKIINPPVGLLSGNSDEDDNNTGPDLKKLIDLGLKTTKPHQSRKNSKVKYTCPSCKTNVWGKPELNVGCMSCEVEMTAQADGN